MSRPAPARERILDAAQAIAMENGFGSTTVDAVLERAGASKGAFFHHFPSKALLGRALVDRYSKADEAALERFMAAAEAESDDPAEQIVAFVRVFEEEAGAIVEQQPSCLLVSFIYEAELDGAETDALVAEAIGLWRQRILAKLQAAASTRPGLEAHDLEALADQVFAVFEGGFLLARAMGDRTALGRQLAHYRTYLELLLGLEVAPPRSGGGDLAQAAPFSR